MLLEKLIRMPTSTATTASTAIIPSKGQAAFPEKGGRLARADWGIILGLLFVGLALALIVAPQWLDPQDDGLYMHQAPIIMQGGSPYRDFLLHDAPLGNVWHALLLSLFGYDALVLR